MEGLLNLPYSRYVALLGLDFAIVLCSAYLLFSLRRRALEVSDTPVSKIRSAAQGYVALSGIQMNPKGETLLTKMGRRPCTWCRIKSYTYNEAGQKQEYVETSNMFIRIIDGTGECLIDPAKAEIVGTQKDIWIGEIASPSTLCNNVFKRMLFSFFKPSASRYEETYFVPTTQLYALGKFVTITNADNQHEHMLLPDDESHYPFVLSGLDEEDLSFEYKCRLGAYAFVFTVTFCILETMLYFRGLS